MAYIGKRPGFGQQFNNPEPSPYLSFLAPLAGKCERSKFTLALIRDDIKKNKIPKTVEPCDPLYCEARRRTFKAFMLDERVKMCHLNDVFKKDLPIWSSSPGLPWMNLGYKTKNDIRRDPDAIKKIRWFWHRVKCFKKTDLPDCCAYARTHIFENGETKVRIVWEYPATVTFGEAVFALPLINAYKKGGFPIAYGYEIGNAGCKKIYHQLKGNYYLSIRFESFNETLPAWLISTAFEILSYNINFLEYEDYGIACVCSTINMFNTIKDYAIHTKIRMCNGERYIKHNGLASGSYFTQLVGSICNHLLLTYAMLQLNVKINNLIVFGADSLMAAEKQVEPDDVRDVLERLGMTVNVEKSGSSRYLSDLTFLGFKINDGIPSQERDKQLASLVYPELPDRDWNSVASRALGIMYSNFGVDPLVDHWCREIVNFRPFDIHLTRDQQRFLGLLGIENISKEPPTMHDLCHRIGYTIYNNTY